MASQNLLELARQGNPQAINAFLGRMLEPKGITAKTVVQDDRLHLLLESNQALDQAVLVPFVHQVISRLGATRFKSLTIYGKQRNQQGQPWSQVINLAEPDLTPSSTHQELNVPSPPPGAHQELNVPPPPPIVPTRSASRDNASAVSPIPPVASPPDSADQPQVPAPPLDVPQPQILEPLRDAPQSQVPAPPPDVPQSPASAATSALTQSFETADVTVDELTDIPPLALNWDSQLDDQTAADSAPTNPLPQVSPQATPTSEPVAEDNVLEDEPQIAEGEMPIARAIAVVGLALALVGIVLLQGRMISTKARTTIDQADALIAKSKKPGDVDDIKRLQGDMNTVIQELRTIPAIPFLVPDGVTASEKLDILQQEQRRLQQRLKQEDMATKVLAVAQRHAQEASDMVKVSPNNLSVLRQAEQKWGLAIAELEKVPSSTNAGREAAQKLPTYKTNYAEVKKQIAALSQPRTRR
ncbi:MAG: hypothetical protein NZ772_13290 [Cyanobacteria bacterium]|nr:hypothetical protein [Cyanobacteriota bacterium]MDW8202365.1 hypothetical protein [Cyanobacteriota bacterium SKYGB_h_bin112]